MIHYYLMLFFLLSTITSYAQNTKFELNFLKEIERKSDLPNYNTSHTVWKVNNPASYIYTWNDNGPVLNYLELYHNDQFNFGYDEKTNLYYRYNWGLTGHDGQFVIRKDLLSNGDTIDLKNFDYDETGPHNFLGDSDTTFWLIAKKNRQS